MIKCQKILIPTDGEKSSYKALKLLENFFKDDLEVIILAVANEFIPHHFQRKKEVKELNKMFLEEAQKNADAMKKEIPDSVNVTTKVVTNASTADGIVDFAHDEDVDLIIIAKSNKKGLERYTIGKVTETVVKNADVDVLVIKN